MRVDNTAAGLSILTACTTVMYTVHAEWTPTESAQVRSSRHGHSHTAESGVIFDVSRLSVADVDLPVADSMRVLGVTLDRRLTFDNYVSAVARSCNYHARVIRHIRHLLTLDLAQTFACSMILSRSTTATLCCTALHPAPFRSSSESRTSRRVSFYKRLDGQTSTRYALAAC